MQKEKLIGMRNSIFLYIIITVFIIGCKSSEKSFEPVNEEPKPIDTITLGIDTNAISLYGISTEELDFKKTRVKRNETLAKILYSTHISDNEVNALLNLSTKLFDSRKFKAGNIYTCFYTNKNPDDSRYLVYEIDKFEYLLFSLKDSLYVNRIERETDTVTQYAAFSIKNSLWMTLMEKDMDPNLSIMLSEIYAWTIDFFGLHEGDSVRVVYDEVLVDGERAGITKIHSAWFRHINHDYYAIAFEQDGKTGYFDLEGNSLRKAFLKAPLRYSRISSRFSNSRLHPILKIRRPHHGVDYAAPIGTPVHSIGDGVVIGTTYTKGAGRMVKIKHNSVYSTTYMHLQRFAKGTTTGSHVSQGQTIGYVGSSGLSTGPHLDFRVYKNNHPVDPLKIESPSVDPVKKENFPSFYENIYLALEELRIGQSYLASNTKRAPCNAL